MRKGFWESYAVLDGLPAVELLAILEDRQGHLWFGTAGGASRYDGQSFVNFSTEDGLAHNQVNSILEDREGNLWFATGGFGSGEGGGISRYDGHNFVSFTTEDGLANNRVTCILEDRRGCLWFGTGSWFEAGGWNTESGGISRYDGQSFVNFTVEDGLISNDVRTILEDKAGNLWFGTLGGGVSRYDGHNFVSFTTEDGLANNRVRCILEDIEGNLWFGTDGGVSRYDGESFMNSTMEDCSIHSVTPLSMLQDREGDIWFGTGSGVYRYDGKSFVNLTTEDGLADNRVRSILEDREGNIWFGTWGGGASRYDRGSFVIFSTEDGLAGNIVLSILEDREGNIWFGTDGNGVSCYNGEGFVTFTAEDGLAANNIVSSILEDRKGDIWFANGAFNVEGDGVSRYDGQGFVIFTTEDGLVHNDVRAILEDKRGNLWFGTWGGVSRYDGQNFVSFTMEDGLAENHVLSISEDSKGNLWFGTYGGPVSRYDGSSFVTFTSKDGLANGGIRCIAEDKEENLWFAAISGVSCYNGRDFRTITAKDGLSCNRVVCILEDREGYLCFGTSGGGVCKYDGTNFQEITTRDGLAHDTVRCMIQDRMGNFWFASASPHGVTRYTPSSKAVKPRVRITQAIADKVYESPDTIETSASQVIFEYKALSFRTKFDRIKYIHKLEGKDIDWSRATHERRIRYEDLRPGDYVFRVQAIDRDLNYSEPASVKLEVIPDPRNHRIIQLEAHIREQELAEMERMHQELEDARQIQQSLLPDSPPELEGFEIAGISLPAREVSGDFYSYLPLGDSTGIVLADVTGKSVKAAMVAALASGTLNAEIKGRTELWNSPSKILSELNASIHPHLIRGMYTAMSLGILQPTDRRLVFSNAGIPYPIMKRGSEVWELEVNGMPLGLMHGVEYEDLSVELEPGDFLVFCSDGVIEAENQAEEMYQSERLLRLIQQADPRLSAQEMVDLVVRDVAAFTGDMDQSDDTTVVALRCKEYKDIDKS